MSRLSKAQGITLLVVLVTSFIATFTASALNLSVPVMGDEFHAGAAMIGWVVTAYVMTAAAFSVPFGRLADLTSRKKVFASGILVFGVSAFGCIVSLNIWMLLFFRMTQGIGCAMIFSGNQPLLISAFPPERKGRMLGYSIASTYIGLSAGPVVGGLLNHYLGWRSIFAVTAAISAAAFLMTAFYLPDSSAAKEVKKKLSRNEMDLCGSVLFVVMIFLILYGFSSWSAGWYAKGLILLGIVLAVIFVHHEKGIEHPVIQVRLFTGNKSYLCANAAALMNYGATYALSYILSIYLQVVRGFDSQISGVILIFQPLVMAILSPYAGRLSDHRSPFRLAALGMLLCAVGLASFIPINESYPIWRIILSLMIVGFGFAFFTSPNTNAVMSCVTSKDYGVASSLLATMRNSGQTISMAIVTFIVSSQIGDSMMTDASFADILRIVHITFLTFTVICLSGALISLVHREAKGTQEQSEGEK